MEELSIDFYVFCIGGIMRMRRVGTNRTVHYSGFCLNGVERLQLTFNNTSHNIARKYVSLQVVKSNLVDYTLLPLL